MKRISCYIWSRVRTGIGLKRFRLQRELERFSVLKRRQACDTVLYYTVMLRSLLTHVGQFNIQFKLGLQMLNTFEITNLLYCAQTKTFQNHFQRSTLKV